MCVCVCVCVLVSERERSCKKNKNTSKSVFVRTVSACFHLSIAEPFLSSHEARANVEPVSYCLSVRVPCIHTADGQRRSRSKTCVL